MKPKDAIITFRLEEADRARLEQICEEEDIPVAQYIRKAIKEKLEKEGQKNV